MPALSPRTALEPAQHPWLRDALALGVAGAAPLAASILDLSGHGLATFFLGLLALTALTAGLTTGRSGPPRERWRLLGVTLAHGLFWLGFARLSALGFALAGDHSALPFEVTPTAFAVLATALVVALVPAVRGLSRGLDRRGLRPSFPGSFASAFVLLAAATFFLALGIEWERQQGLVASAPLLIALALQVGAGVLAARLGWDAMGSPGEHPKGARPALAWPGALIWLSTFAFALGLAGVGPLPVARLTATAPPLGELALGPAFAHSLTLGLLSIAAAVVLVFLWRPLSARLAPNASAPRPRGLGGRREPTALAVAPVS